MMIAFGKGDDSWTAFEELRTKMRQAGSQMRRTVGYPSGHVEKEVTWHAKEHVWSLLDSEETKSRFWCCFGVQNPKDVPSLDIAVEVNPRLEGTDLRVAGAFATDAHGVVHLCHNGRIGGGKPGVGKAAFIKYYRGNFTEMAYGNRIVPVVDLGPIRSPRLPARLGRFARQVVRVKGMIAEFGHDPHSSPSRTGNVLRTDTQGFSPEFSGNRRPYTPQGVIEARADHGPVVDALAESVEKLGYAPRNDQMRDLFLTDRHNRASVLFEVKTDITRTSIYTAVGQLFLNGQVADRDTQLVLVDPGRPDRRTHKALGSIGIDVLPYKWEGDEPVISVSDLQSLIC